MQNETNKTDTIAALDAMKSMADSPTLIHVLKFAARMEAKLEKNRHKGSREGWIKNHPWELVERMLDETVEVQQCFIHGGREINFSDGNDLADECADVANFCMMIADRATV